MGIEITLKNQSYDATYTVVLFPKNTHIAWKVLSSPAYSHTFLYPTNVVSTLCMGVIKGITEGQELTPEILAGITTEISLEGIKKADIIMTGGGLREPYQFILQPR
ncbi:hypothetical protein SAMN05421788_101861 [Filimonas lacunae]|uniref:Uncharacterized protein n=1 Tax=Filimonas lacunae TaxID=477680 RepID=A0A173MP60_9BACT|nr:hypothetical protein [Filimonas lacunae]BAV09424.1 hypothetical protein FLA_5473 [Filimonas lacunae]SIS72907.1 hypothetical protein SAMN05421788_101861 [Filimonas lacunae]